MRSIAITTAVNLVAVIAAAVLAAILTQVDWFFLFDLTP